MAVMAFSRVGTLRKWREVSTSSPRQAVRGESAIRAGGHSVRMYAIVGEAKKSWSVPRMMSTLCAKLSMP